MTKRSMVTGSAGCRHVVLFVAMVAVVFTAMLPSPALAALWKSKPVWHHFPQHKGKYQPPVVPAHHGPYPGPKPVLFSPEPLTGKPSLTHPFTPSMQEMVVPLTRPLATKAGATPTYQPVAAHAVSSDGQIEVSVPASALTQSDIIGAGGAVNLVIDQIDGPSGSTGDAGGSGKMSFGSYEFVLQNAAGQEITLGTGTHQPFTFTYHWLSKSAPISFALDPVMLVLNGSHRVALPHPLRHPGKNQAVAMQFDVKAQTITGIIPLSSSGTGTISATAPVAYFGAAQNFQNDLHTGGLNDAIPIAVPSGPGGFAPSLNLSYSSDAVSATHNPESAASWVGEGWSLDPGEITWSESNFMANGANPYAGSVWQNEWNLIDAHGNSSPLIPPNTTVSTYYDDSGNSPAISAQPLVWHTAPESHAKISSYTNPTVDCTNFPQQNPCGSGSYTVQPPCFRVWEPNGDMEEFGCTTDSRQFYPAQHNGSYVNDVSAWRLDLITDPNGNQIHFTYGVVSATRNGITYPNDLVLQSITWDDPTCRNAQTMCTGSGWNPQMEVVFEYSHAVAHFAPGNSSPCTQSGILRCDDPQPGTQETIPPILATEVLNAIDVKVASSGSFQLLRKYTLAYAQSNASTITDPFTGQTESAAGYLLLEQVTETGTDSTSYPVQTFKYTNPGAEYYEDSGRAPSPSTNCGPAWNTGIRPGHSSGPCVLWSQTYNGYHLSEADNNAGLQQTFSWQDMRTNQHGVDTSAPAPDNNAGHAYACTDIQQNKTYGWNQYPCDLADDNGWSHITLTSRTGVVDAPTSTKSSNPVTSLWTYNYNLANLTAQECSDCKVGMYWGDANNGDYLDFYQGIFTGFFFAQVVNPDASLEDDYYYSTEGWGVWNRSIVPCRDGQSTCPQSPDWDLTNAATGRPYQVDQFDTEQNNSWNLLKRTLTTYTATCPPSGVSGSPQRTITYWGSTTYNWGGNLVSAVDLDNPIADCDVQPTQVQTFLADGTASPGTSTNPMAQTVMQYNSYGQLTQRTTTGNDLGSTPTIVSTIGYIYNDHITTSATSATGTYIVDRVATSDTEDGASNSKACAFTHYDGSTTTPVPTGQQSSLTRGLATQVDRYATTCTSSGGTGLISTQAHYDVYGNPINTTDADADGGISGHTASTGTCAGYTACTTYDSTFATLPTSQINVLNQTATINYTSSQAFGYGLWPSSTTDPNGQTTSTTYDGLGRTLTTTLPGEGSGLTTTQTTYSPISTCPTTGPSEPCLEVDTTQRLDSGHTLTQRNFYDGWGHLVETRRPASYGSSKDVVQYMLYDVMGRLQYQSVPYFVTAYTGSQMGTAAYSVPVDPSQEPHTYAKYDGLGRVIVAQDADYDETDTSYSPVCVNSVCDERTLAIDPDFLQHDTYADALGRVVSSHDLDGNSNLLRTYSYGYDYLGRRISTTYADGTHSATTTYDLLGRQTAVNDPDLGNWTYRYDPNGNITSTVDPRGSSGTVYLGYDGLNRHLWTSTSSNGASPLASYTYDQGSNGIGRLASEQFASGPSQSVVGSYAYSYDARGRTTQEVITIAGAGKTYQTSYNDADQPLTLTYADGTILTSTYDTQDWLTSITLNQGGTNTNLADSFGYSGWGGPFGLPTSAQVAADTASWQAIYDPALRLDNLNVYQLSSPNTTWYSEHLQYDADGLVWNRTTQVPAGTMDEAYCSDSLNHLVWSGSTGTEPSTVNCGSPPSGTTIGSYTQSSSYDTLDRLTSGPAGTYTYGDSNHLDAVTSTSSGYTASYDSAGEMTCRAPSSATTCQGTATGQQLSYDALNRLTTWLSGGNSAYDAYDGEGQRVWQQTSSGGTTTTTYYGGLEEVSSTGTTTTTTQYFAAGPLTAVAVNGTLSYLIHTSLGSIGAALDHTGNLSAVTLYGPWGQSISSSGSMPTAKGFIGQYGDATTGLDYLNARYYDPVVGQFTQADLMQGPNRYTYADGNPPSESDPSGQLPGLPVYNGDGRGGNENNPNNVGDAQAIQLQAWQAAGVPMAGACSAVQCAVGFAFTAAAIAATPFYFAARASQDLGAPGWVTAGLYGASGLSGESVEGPVLYGGAVLFSPNVSAHQKRDAVLQSGADLAFMALGHALGHLVPNPCGGANSFAASTSVATPAGQTAIGEVQVGSKVLAYDPPTGKTKPERVEHVFLNHDPNLLDVTLRSELAI